MALKKDPYQTAAIETVGSDILVSASAGAGKTRVLVERLIKRCLTDRVQLNEILAVTFTKAAAEEMKNRIAKSLQERHDGEQDPAEREYIRNQLIYLQTADIMTIDSFCLSVIEKYSNVIGLNPAQTANILDNSMNRQLQHRAFSAALEKHRKTDGETLVDLLRMCDHAPGSYAAIESYIFNIISCAESSINPEQWYAEASSRLYEITGLKQLPSDILTLFFTNIRIRFDEAMLNLQRMIDFPEPSEKIEKGRSKLIGLKNRMLNMRPYLLDLDYPQFLQHFQDLGTDTETPTDGKFTSLDAANRSFTDYRKAFYDALKKLSEDLYDDSLLIKDHNETIPYLRLLLSLAQDTSANLQALKEALPGMDFSDIERYAWKILIKNEETVAKRYRSRYKEVMVDEFQDTSVLQNAILTKVAPKNAMFRVGDVKQSIYRFRQAKPSLMRQISEDPDTVQLPLVHNYRSKENIVEFCNILFRQLMNIPGSHDRYGDADIVSIGTEAQKLPVKDPVHMALIVTKSDNRKIMPEFDGKKLKAMWIANKIQELMDPASGNNYRFKDFCILVRSHADKPVIRSVFETYGIPYDIDNRTGFFQSELCQTVLSILRVINDPDDMISLTAVATSSMYRITAEELAVMKLSAPSLSAGLRQARPDLFEDIRHFRMIGQTLGALELLKEIGRKNNFYDFLPDDGKSNYDFLYEKTARYDYFLSVRDLLDIMETSEEEKSEEAASHSKDDDLVRVATIHQSKGLQYGVVFLWGTSTFKGRTSADIFLADDELYLGMTHYDLPYMTQRRTPLYQALYYKDNIEDLEECSRLLYVALTRPMEKLYIVDTVDKEEDLYENELSLMTLARRKGLTGLIRFTLKDNPDYFRIQYVSAAIPSVLSPIGKAYVDALPVYSADIEPETVAVKPSDHSGELLPDLSSGADGGAAYGTRMHAVLADLPNTLWQEEMLAPYGLSKSEADAILAFGNSDLYRQALCMDIHKELWFYLEEKHARTQGIIDFAAVGTDTIILLDFKTDNAAPETLPALYANQLALYEKALRKQYPDHTIRTYIWSLHHKKAIEIH